MGGFGVFSHLMFFENISNHSDKVFFYYAPVIPIESNREAVEARGLILLRAECGQLDFLLCNFLVQISVLDICDFALNWGEKIHVIRRLRTC